MKIAMLASESNPFLKTGGLGDVVYSLSKQLADNDNEVYIVIPFYDTIKRSEKVDPEYVTSFDVYMSWRKEEAKVFKTTYNGVNYLLIDSPHYFARERVYGDYDDGERFAFFTIACQILFRVLDIELDIVHLHDWQVAMFPCLVREKHDDFYRNTKFVLTIHNPAFQGLMGRNTLGEFYSLPDYLYDNGQVRFNDQVSTLKSGIIYADKIATVSPTHRMELLSDVGGMGLQYVFRIRENDFVGILNGIDNGEFNPENDPLIPYNFNKDNLDEMKLKLKKKLFSKTPVIFDKKEPLYAMVTRLTWQKGIDIALSALEEVVKKGARAVIIGSGEYDLERRALDLMQRYPDRVYTFIGYSDSLAHNAYAASDYFLMPSLFEPCGIGQMLAQRYGSLPIVRATGGLSDSVISFNGVNLEKANGFNFHRFRLDALTSRILTTYYLFKENKELKNTLARNAMLTDHSWAKSALAYQKIYEQLLGR